MKQQLTIGWLYPELMSTYGDRGNIIVLTKRCEWRDIDVAILRINEETTNSQLSTVDLLFGGGAQDREQTIVMQDLHKKKAAIEKIIEDNTPSLFVCGAPQLMGKYYEPAIGERIEGLGIFDMVSKHPGKHQSRLIGNTVAEVAWENLGEPGRKDIIVGFENHGGRTYLGHNAKPFAKVIKGYGNNGKDHTEGVVYKNAIGCYFHGPLLPKNPAIADWLIQKALEVKYKENISLKQLDDTAELQAQKAIAMKLGIGV
jgi:CobQ-like glutamine amidotransferase family enzyme